MSDTSATSGSHLCQICNSITPKYTCPRCSIPYCSMNCYKSTLHMNCSEEFYKEWVEVEIKSQVNNPEHKKIMMDILKRVHKEDTSLSFDENEEDIDEACEQLDSDDDEDIPDLADRIKNVDLDDGDGLWEVLTDAERQEFEALLRNGEEGKILPNWTPWWSLEGNDNEDELIKEINEHEKIKIVDRCPKLLEIPYISAVERASSTAPLNILNVLCSYVLVVFHYDGDYHNSPKEAVSMFLQLCDNIGESKVFDSEASAVEAVTEKAFDYQLLRDYEENVITDNLKRVIQGPSKQEPTFYMLSAVSDLYRLFTAAKRELSREKIKVNSLEFRKKFKTHIDEQYLNRVKISIPLYLKKLEYYFVWIHKYGQRMLELKILQCN